MNKFLSYLLILSMVLSMCPIGTLTASAEEEFIDGYVKDTKFADWDCSGTSSEIRFANQATTDGTTDDDFIQSDGKFIVRLDGSWFIDNINKPCSNSGLGLYSFSVDMKFNKLPNAYSTAFRTVYNGTDGNKQTFLYVLALKKNADIGYYLDKAGSTRKTKAGTSTVLNEADWFTFDIIYKLEQSATYVSAYVTNKTTGTKTSIVENGQLDIVMPNISYMNWVVDARDAIIYNSYNAETDPAKIKDIAYMDNFKVYKLRELNPAVTITTGGGNSPVDKFTGDTITFNYSSTDTIGYLNGTNPKVILKCGATAVKTENLVSSCGSISTTVAAGENNYKVEFTADGKDAISSNIIKVTGVERQPIINLSLKDSVPDGRVYIGDTITFNYTTEECEGLLTDGGAYITVYEDSIKLGDDIAFTSDGGNFDITAKEGVHKYSVSLFNNADIFVDSSAEITLTGEVKVFTLSLTSDIVTDNTELPAGSKVKFTFDNENLDDVVSSDNKVYIYNNDSEVASFNTASGECLIQILEGTNTITAKTQNNTSEIKSTPMTLIGVGDGRTSNYYKDIHYEENEDVGQNWYSRTGPGRVALSVTHALGNEGTEGYFLAKEDEGVNSAGAYVSITKDRMEETGDRQYVDIAMYHENRTRDYMMLPENEIFTYNVYVKNTGINNHSSFMPLRIMTSAAASVLEMVATADGYECRQYITPGGNKVSSAINIAKDGNWHKYGVLYNSKTHMAQFFIDDVLLAVTESSDSTYSFSGGFCGQTTFPVTFPENTPQTSVEYALDEIKIRSYAPQFTADMYVTDSVTDTAVNNEDVNVFYDGKKIKLVFTEEMNADSLSGIMLKADDKQISSDGIYNETEKSFTFNAFLEPYKKYEVNLSNLTTKAGASAKEPLYIGFTTKKTPLSVQSAESAGSKLNVILNNENNETKTVLLFAAYYTSDGKKLLKSDSIKIVNPIHNTTYELTPGTKDAGSKLRVLLLEFNNLSYIDMLEN